jgi:hypothetical protein
VARRAFQTVSLHMIRIIYEDLAFSSHWCYSSCGVRIWLWKARDDNPFREARKWLATGPIFYCWFGKGVKRGRPLRRVSTGKKASVPNFFLIGLHTLLPRSLLHRALLEPVFSSFDFRSFLAEPLLNEATRSVTHLVLAPDRKCLFIKSFPSFLRLSCDRLSAPIPLQRDQKTFSTGPCSFSFKSFGFVVACHQAPNVQPVFDSRHGRIACKILSPAVPLLVG